MCLYIPLQSILGHVNFPSHIVSPISSLQRYWCIWTYILRVTAKLLANPGQNKHSMYRTSDIKYCPGKRVSSKCVSEDQILSRKECHQNVYHKIKYCPGKRVSSKCVSEDQILSRKESVIKMRIRRSNTVQERVSSKCVSEDQ